MSNLLNNKILNILEAIFKIANDGKNPILVSLTQTLKKELECEIEIAGPCVLTPKVYDAREFLEIVTGNYYLMPDDDDFETVHKILCQEGYEDDECNTVWDFPLDEIDEIVTNGLQVVLVSGSVYNSETKEFVTEYHWIEVPDGCAGKFTEA